uniref:Uncharacterized protein n=1 Tax=Cucumis melo TaxID=3656 RepID=A0A9I9E0X7_CUCME
MSTRSGSQALWMSLLYRNLGNWERRNKTCVRRCLPSEESNWAWGNIKVSIWVRVTSFFARRDKNDAGVVKISKFAATYRWVLRCTLWPETGGRFYLHVPVGPNHRLSARLKTSRKEDLTLKEVDMLELSTLP